MSILISLYTCNIIREGVSYYDADYIYAFVDVRIDAISNYGLEECYLEWDEDETTYGRYISVSATVDGYVQSNWRLDIYSYHYATIDDISDECMSGIGE